MTSDKHANIWAGAKHIYGCRSPEEAEKLIKLLSDKKVVAHGTLEVRDWGCNIEFEVRVKKRAVA